MWNRSKDKTKDCAAAGAKVAGSIKELAADADVIISMIADDPALEAVSTGPDGSFATAKSGAIFIDMSTVSPVASAKVNDAAKAKGIKYLRAPVSGSTVLAKGGDADYFCFRPQGCLRQVLAHS